MYSSRLFSQLQPLKIPRNVLTIYFITAQSPNELRSLSKSPHWTWTHPEPNPDPCQMYRDPHPTQRQRSTKSAKYPLSGFKISKIWKYFCRYLIFLFLHFPHFSSFISLFPSFSHPLPSHSTQNTHRPTHNTNISTMANQNPVKMVSGLRFAVCILFPPLGVL